MALSAQILFLLLGFFMVSVGAFSIHLGRPLEAALGLLYGIAHIIVFTNLISNSLYLIWTAESQATGALSQVKKS